MKKKIGWLLVIILLLAGAVTLMILKRKEKVVDMNEIDMKIIETDKSMYSPNETVTISYIVANTTDEAFENLCISLKVTHLERIISELPIGTIDLKPGEQKELSYQWMTPDEDFTGYLLEVGFKNGKRSLLKSDTIGIDVSSSWVKFPRYGYLSDFEQEVDAENMIEGMNRLHINGIEYYDWHYLHHQPLAEGGTAENPGIWKDWSGRIISGEAIVTYIKEAKDRNMVNMAYNMIYAGTDTFFEDEDGNPTKANDWKLFFAEGNERGEGNFTFYMGTSPSGNGNLYFVNPLNKEWQQHIFSEENNIFDVFEFDGWHGDTVGDWGDMVTADGSPLGYREDNTPIYLVKDTYTQFLNAAKEALGTKYLSFNPVGAQGIKNANISNSDVLYTEFWPWDFDREGNLYDTYASLVKEIERSNEDSKETSIDGRGKSLVVKAYINYYKTNGYMNAPGALLADAAVYAAGGSRLELGNGQRMLHVEYYPKDFPLDDALLEKMISMADFTVAYENLLRDGQQTIDRDVVIEDYAHGKDGNSDTIWTYTRADSNYEVLHLINLLGTENEWRDERGKKFAPLKAEEITVTYYTDKDISSVYLASPDLNNCKSIELTFKNGTDKQGKYITFTVPTLEYWDMIYMK